MRFPMTTALRHRAAATLGVKEIGHIDWFRYDDTRLAEQASQVLQRMTGDRCNVILPNGSDRFVISRTDHGGKEVRPK